MSLSLVGRRMNVSTLCQKWRRLHTLSKKSICPDHKSHFSLFSTKDGKAFRPPRYAAASFFRAESFHCSSVRLKKREPEGSPPRELDLLRYDLKVLKNAPKPALYLGFAGLIPFVSAPLFMAITESYVPEVAYAQVVYGASIVSFLGGARWGFALPEGSPAKPDWLNLANSVVPSLIAWAALLLSHNITQSSMLVIMGLGISLHYDLALLPTYPSWFKALRTILTIVALFSLVATLVLNGFYPEKRYLTEE